MRRFLLRRALWMVLTVWAVATLAFFLMRAVPGGPFSGERRLAPEVEAVVAARYHLDWPLWRQYLQFLGPLNLDDHGLLGDSSDVWGGALAGDLGPSFRQRDYTVNELLAQSLPISIELGLAALLWAVLLGVPAGVAAALRPRGWLDLALRGATTLGIVLPNFVIATLLLMLFAFQLGWLPVAGHGSARHLVLPALALGAPFAAYVARLTRTGTLEALSAEHVFAARAKGLPRWRIVRDHVLPAALLPVASYLGPATAGILTGSLVIERIFAIPGAGTHFVGSALDRDYTLAMGVTLTYTVFVFVLNTCVDALYPLLDPRISLEDL
ncbi:MAG TPA: ABC transporter permease [Planctomycetota bacterium]|nr:ABC transporter permease [Planctomycetota bacterium]